MSFFQIYFTCLITFGGFGFNYGCNPEIPEYPWYEHICSSESLVNCHLECDRGEHIHIFNAALLQYKNHNCKEYMVQRSPNDPFGDLECASKRRCDLKGRWLNLSPKTSHSYRGEKHLFVYSTCEQDGGESNVVEDYVADLEYYYDEYYGNYEDYEDRKLDTGVIIGLAVGAFVVIAIIVIIIMVVVKYKKKLKSKHSQRSHSSDAQHDKAFANGTYEMTNHTNNSPNVYTINTDTVSPSALPEESPERSFESTRHTTPDIKTDTWDTPNEEELVDNEAYHSFKKSMGDELVDNRAYHSFQKSTI